MSNETSTPKIDWAQLLYPSEVLELCNGPKGSARSGRMSETAFDDVMAEARITGSSESKVIERRIAKMLLSAKNDFVDDWTRQQRTRRLLSWMNMAVLLSNDELHSRITSIQKFATQLRQESRDEYHIEIAVFETELAIRGLEREARDIGSKRGANDASIGVCEDTPPHNMDSRVRGRNIMLHIGRLIH